MTWWVLVVEAGSGINFKHLTIYTIHSWLKQQQVNHVPFGTLIKIIRCLSLCPLCSVHLKECVVVCLLCATSRLIAEYVGVACEIVTN